MKIFTGYSKKYLNQLTIINFVNVKVFTLLFFFIFPALFFSQSENIDVLSHWTKTGLPTTYDGESVFNEVWGVEVNGENYAIIGSTLGTHILRVNQNNQLEEIHFVMGKYAGVDAIHRDFHDYKGYLYAVCDENYSSLQIMDLHFLPDSLPVLYDSDSLIIRAHNIFIDTAKSKLYACAVATSSGFHAMSVYDINNPIEPNVLYHYDNVSQVHDAYVYNDTAFLNCGNEGLKVIRSVSSGASTVPVQIGELSIYPFKGYNHSGWLNEAKTTYVMCDETPGMDVKVLDVSDLNNITVSSTFSTGFYDNTLPHNVIVRGDVAYVSYYNDGVHVYDIKNPSQPKRLGYYDTYPGSNDKIYRGVWGVYPIGNGNEILVSDRTYGLYLMSFDPPPIINSNPYLIFPNPAEGYIYFYRDHVGEADYQLEIYDAIGKRVRQFACYNDYKKIDLSSFNTGIYIIKYMPNNDDVVLTAKFFVK